MKLKLLASLICAMLVITAAGCGGQSAGNDNSQDVSPAQNAGPNGTFKGCMYLDGKPVDGYITFYNEDGSKAEMGIDGKFYVKDGCTEIELTPGNYEVGGRYLGDPACGDETGGGCLSEHYQFEISQGGTVSLDIEMFPTGN